MPESELAATCPSATAFVVTGNTRQDALGRQAELALSEGGDRLLPDVLH